MLKAVSGSWCRLELLASWSCFVERTTVNKLVNGKFTAPACGPIKPGDRGDDENDCDLCVCVCDGDEKEEVEEGVAVGERSEKSGRRR